MKVIGKIFAGISIGLIVSVLLGTVLMQGVLFKLGAELLGVGPLGLTYFVGCLIASLILMFFPGAREHKKAIGVFAVATVLIGFTAWAGFFQDQGMGASGDLLNAQAYISQLVSGVAKFAFWVVPAGVTGFFAYLYWETKQG